MRLLGRSFYTCIKNASVLHPTDMGSYSNNVVRSYYCLHLSLRPDTNFLDSWLRIITSCEEACASLR